MAQVPAYKNEDHDSTYMNNVLLLLSAKRSQLQSSDETKKQG